MVFDRRNTETDTMPQMVPSAGFTPPCDYSAFAADSFDLSLLPGGETDLPLSPSTLLYTQSPPPQEKPKLYTTYFPNSPEEALKVTNDIELGPDFQKLLVPEKERNIRSPVHLEVPTLYPSSPESYCSSTDIYQKSLISPNYPASPCESFTLYPNSPNQEEKSTFYTKDNFYPQELYLNTDFQYTFIKKEDIKSLEAPIYSPFQIKEENFLSPCSQVNSPNSCTTYSNHSSPDPVYLSKDNIPLLEETFLETNFLEKQIKQESTVDFGDLLQNLSSFKEILGDEFKKTDKEEKPKSDHKLLRQVLRDTSFQKKYNLKPIDFELGTGFVGSIKMEEPDQPLPDMDVQEMTNEELTREKIEPVLSLAIEQMRKDVDNTCTALGISQDPSQWTSENVKAWIQWTTQQFGLTSVQTELFNIPGAELAALSEEEFSQRAPQNGSILHAQLEIWKAAFQEEDMSMQWNLEATCSSNQSSASSGDMSDDEEEDSTTTTVPKPTGSRGTGSHIHLWQFLKELLASPQVHGSCIRWLDRGKGVFKIEDSVRVAKLWGKRKNRPAMNYDKLSRSIRQYYKKGIMKKTERSQRLVYQFCHPYCL